MATATVQHNTRLPLEVYETLVKQVEKGNINAFIVEAVRARLAKPRNFWSMFDSMHPFTADELAQLTKPKEE